MRHGVITCVFGLAAACLLGAGCRSAPPKTVVVTAEDTDEETARLAEAHAHYATGVIHELNEQPDAALEEYRLAALADPSNERLIQEVARRYVQSKQFEKALELLKGAAAAPNASGLVYAQLGVVYSQLGKLDQAIEANRTSVKKEPTLLAGYQNLVLNYLQKKQPAAALETLDTAAKQPKSSAEFLIGLGELYGNLALQVSNLKTQAQAKALAVLSRAEKQDLSSPQLRFKLAESYGALGESSRAAQVYLDLLKSLPDAPMIRERVRARLAEIYLRGDEKGKAVEQLEAIVRDDPTNPQAYFFLGNLAMEERKWPQAIEYFNKAILLNPGLEQAYYDLANAQMTSGNNSDALATLERARRKFQQNFVIEFMTGIVLSRQKAYEEAIRHYIAAEVIGKATDPRRLNQGFYFQLGAAYERKGEIAEAEKCFEKSLQLAPDFAEAMNYLGYMWAEHGMKLEQARDLIEKAVKQEPKNAAYLDSLGWVLFRLHQPNEALEYVLKAIALSEEADATVQDHLGDIYAALQQMDKAREAWKKSLSIEDNEKVRQKLNQRAAP